LDPRGHRRTARRGRRSRDAKRAKAASYHGRT
jgi:hypothetical protein